MSLARWIYWGALICGWGAFVGWLAAEVSVQNYIQNALALTALTGGLVGAALGAGLGVFMALNGFTWPRLATQVLVGFAGGLLVGVLSGLFAQLLYQMTGGHFRFIAWTLFGLGIGAITGLLDHSLPRLRNGLIGGALGGLCGGLLFDPIGSLSEGMTPRAVGFTILGVCIGAFVGIVQVILREAWLTVMDGYRVGRQLILTHPVTVLGRAEHVAMPFIGASNSTLEKEHVRIVRQSDGRYFVEDNHTATGTRLNQQPVTAPVLLRNDDVIRLGSNLVRFNERTKRRQVENDQKAPSDEIGNAAPSFPSNSQPTSATATRALPPVPPLRQQGTKPPPPALGTKLPAPPPPHQGTRPPAPPPPVPGTKAQAPNQPGTGPAPPPPPRPGIKLPAPKAKPPLPPPPGGKLPPPPRQDPLP